MVLPLLVAGGYGAAALASAAGAARLRRQLAKMAAGPAGDPLSRGVPLRASEREIARLGRTLVISDELQVREGGDTLHTLFDYVLVSSERIVLHNAHSTDDDFHEAEAEMSLELAAVAGCVAQGGLQSELAAFVFTHGYKIELTVSTVWGQDEQDFSLTLSFESLPERDNFRSALASAREQWNNGASVASPALVSKALLGSGTPAASSAETTAGGEGGSSPSASSSSASSVVVGSVLRVVEAAKVRASPALDSEQVGMLLCNERVLVLEVVTLSSTVEYHPDDSGEDEEDENEAEADETDSDTEEGLSSTRTAVVHSRHRVRFHRGWASVRASDGDLLLVPDTHLEPEPELEQQPELSMLSLAGSYVTGAASEAVKMLSQSERERRLELEQAAAAEREQASSMDAELSGVHAEIAAQVAVSGGTGDSDATSGATGGGGGGRPRPLARQLSLPRLSVQSSLLRLDVPQEHAALLELQYSLPPLLQAFDWSLKYRLSQHGASLVTLLRQTEMSAPLLLIAKVQLEGGGGKYLLGGLASRTFGEKVQGTNEIVPSGKWKGTGQSLIFGMALHEDAAVESGGLQTWGWTRRSSCFQLVGVREGLALGGGGDFGYGIWFDPQLQVCTSSSCATYGNKSSLLHPAAFADDPQSPVEMLPPHPGAVTGAVVELEVWAFV